MNVYLALVVSMMFDPISLVGWVVAGIVARKIPVALTGALIWSIFMDVFVMMLEPGYGGYLMPARIVAGLIVAAGVWSIAWAFRRGSASSPPA